MGSPTRLCYIEAGHVEASAQDLSGFDVITEAGKRLGQLVGLVVDPPVRRILYLVVRQIGLFGKSRLLVPMSAARLDLDQRAVQVDLESGADVRTFNAQEFAPFSDEDMVDAMFRRRGAQPTYGQTGSPSRGARGPEREAAEAAEGLW